MESLEVDEDTMMTALADLEKERIAAADEHSFSGHPDFASRVRGGESQVLKSGEGAHAHQSQCTSKFSTAWARRRGLHATFKATHGPRDIAQAKILCRSWCHRMQFFYNLEKASAEGPGLIYTAAHIASYVEPSELLALCMDGASPAWADRITAIRMIPR